MRKESTLVGSVADAAVCLPYAQVPSHPAPRTVVLGTWGWEPVPEAKINHYNPDRPPPPPPPFPSLPCNEEWPCDPAPANKVQVHFWG